MTRVGLVLSGCGHLDGSEIHEATLAMLTLQEAGATVCCYAPVHSQAHVTSHLTRQRVEGETRSVLEESARIARGEVRDLRFADAAELDAVVLPGGFGAALNLCDFAVKGAGMAVDPDLERLLIAMHESRKPIGAICIAPVILAKVFGKLAPRLTVGDDREVSAKLAAMGATPVDCPVDACVTDEKNLFVTTPAYMYEAAIKDIHPGIRHLASAVVRLAQQRGL